MNTNQLISKETNYLTQKTEDFGLSVINLCRKIKADHINRPLIWQLIRSATSIGSNYAEADNAESHKEFINKIAIAKKEAKETEYYALMLIEAERCWHKELAEIQNEAVELREILNNVYLKAKNKKEFEINTK